jgi:hypothetical protein
MSSAGIVEHRQLRQRPLRAAQAPARSKHVARSEYM